MTGGWGDGKRRIRVGARTRSGEMQARLEAVSDEDLIRYAHQALTRPANASFSDSRLWTTWTHMFSTPDVALTTDYLSGWSNLRSVIRDLQKQWPLDVELQYVASWTYSRLAVMAIRVVHGNGEIHPAFATACAIGKYLQEVYPIYDDEDFSAAEVEFKPEWSDIEAADAELEEDRADGQ